MANQPKKYQKFVATAATATLVATAVVPAASAADTTFSDISSYATEVQEEVLFLADLGVINGFEDGTFKPAQNITRGQAVKMIGRFLEAQGVEAPENWATEQSFSDIAVDRTDRDLVKYAALVKEAGVFQGNGNVLNPSGFTTRENMALILDRLIGQLTGKTAVELAEGLENNVSDLANAKEEAREAIAALNALGVSNAEEFKPKNNTQRVHFASFLARMIELADQQTAEPAIESVEALSKTKVVVTFNTPVDEVTAKNFTIEGAVVNGVELSEDKTVATLDVSGLAYNTEYTVAVADVKVDGEAVDFGSQSFKTPSVTQDFELRVTAADAEVVADGADNVVIKFELLNSLGEVDTNADNMVLEIGSTFGNLATNRVTVQDGVGQVVLSSEFSSKEIIAKVTAQVIEASTDYKDLIGKVAGETTVKFIPAAAVLDPNALTFLGAESNQADRVVVYFDKPVSPATFVETNEDGTFVTVDDETFGVKRQVPKENVEISVLQGPDVPDSYKTIVGLAAVPGNDKAIEIILAKDIYAKDSNGKDVNTTNNILKDNAEVELKIKLGETLNNRKFTLTDARKPEFTGVTVANLRTLDLKFSESVVEGQFSIDGLWTAGKEFSVEFGEFDAETAVDKRDTATVRLNKNANGKQIYFPAGQHSITVTQLKDFAAEYDNANISTTQTLNFNVFADLTPPTATVQVESPEQFRVVFNKDFASVLDYTDPDVAAAKKAKGDNFDELTYIFNTSLRVYDVYNKQWVELEELTVDGTRTGKPVFKQQKDKETDPDVAIELLKQQNLLVAKQVEDPKTKQLVNEVVVELTEDWTNLFENPDDTYHNYQFKFAIDARTFENAANGITNSSFDLNLNYESSVLNAADNTSPVIEDIKQTKNKSVFEVFLNEPVKLPGKDNAGDTPSSKPVPTPLVEFQGKDANGKAVAIEAQVDGYSSATDKDGDSVLLVSTLAGKETLQQLVDAGYDPNWKVVVRSVADDIGNTAPTLTKDFSLVPNVVERPFHIISEENKNPVTKQNYDPDRVRAINYENGAGKDRLEVTFTKAVNFAGNDNLTSVYNWTLNGTKLSELSNVESITLADEPGVGRTNDYEKVIITFANDRAFGKSSNVVSVTKGIKSLDGTVLSGEYEVVAKTNSPDEYVEFLIGNFAAAIAEDGTIAPVYQILFVEAVKAYNSLTNDEKAKLYSNSKVKLVKNSISALPKLEDITAEDANSVNALLEAYNSLDNLQPQITVEEKSTLDKAVDQAAAKVVESKIEGLPTTITPAHKDAVEDAVKAYNALTAAQKVLVPAATLTKLEAAAEAADVEGPTEAPQLTVTPSEVAFDIAPISDNESVIVIKDAVAGAKYKAVIDGQTFYSEASDFGEGIALTGISAEAAKAAVVTDARFDVAEDEIVINLYDTDTTLDALAEEAKKVLTVTENSDVTIERDGQVVGSIEDLTSSASVETLVNYLKSKNVSVESLKGKTYTVTFKDEAGNTSTKDITFNDFANVIAQ